MKVKEILFESNTHTSISWWSDIGSWSIGNSLAAVLSFAAADVAASVPLFPIAGCRNKTAAASSDFVPRLCRTCQQENCKSALENRNPRARSAAKSANPCPSTCTGPDIACTWGERKREGMVDMIENWADSFLNEFENKSWEVGRWLTMTLTERDGEIEGEREGLGSFKGVEMIWSI